MNPQAEQIQTLFSRIARPYDFFNHAFSLGIDIWWRHRLLGAVRRFSPKRVLDLAAGSGDVSLLLQQSGIDVIAADFCAPMLDEAGRKGVQKRVVADGLNLPFPSEAFDGVTIAFGLRNFVDRPLGLREMARVLKPGGSVCILEFSHPIALIRPFYFFHLEHVMPRVTSWMTGEGGAYCYLCETIKAFPDQPALAAMMNEAGFKDVSWKNLTFGLVALHVGRKS